jgi:hypothetical protein
MQISLSVQKAGETFNIYFHIHEILVFLFLFVIGAHQFTLKIITAHILPWHEAKKSQNTEFRTFTFFGQLSGDEIRFDALSERVKKLLPGEKRRPER